MKDLSKIKWHFIHVRRRSPWYMYLWWQGLSTKTVALPGYDHRLRYVGSADHKVLVGLRDWEKHRRTILRILKHDPAFIYKMIQRAYQEHQRFTKLCKRIYKIKNFKQYSNPELADFVARYRLAFFRCTVYSLIPLYVEEDISEEIRKRLRKFSNNLEQDYHVVMTPVKDGTETVELRSLLKLAVMLKQGRRQVFGQTLKKHMFDFSWLKNVGYYEDYYDRAYYTRRVRDVSKTIPEHQLRHIDKERRKRAGELARIIKACKQDKRLVALIQTINEAIYYRSFRGEQMYQSAKYLGRLFQEVALRLGVRPYRELIYFTPAEVIALLQKAKRAPVARIPERKKANILMSAGDWKYIWYEGEKAQRIAARIKVAEGDAKVLKGQVAYPGVVRGIAKIVKNPQDFSKVKSGDILVAMSTQPNYVPALEKAAGFVTEEGGVLCHASVIAREMKKPCVIGTKIATQVFKDGDRVEIDAKHGIVRKI